MPSWKEVKRFCENDEWELYKTTDHDYYRKIEDDGTIIKLVCSTWTNKFWSVKGIIYELLY